MRQDFLGSVPVITASDVVFRLTDRVAGDASTRLDRMLFRAVQEAVRDIGTLHDWTYYKRQVPLYFSGQEVRSCTKVASASPYSDKLWIQASADWPANVLQGAVIIGDIPIAVINHDSATDTLVLDCPPAMLASGTSSLTWVHHTNRLVDVQKVLWVREAASSTRIDHWTPELYADMMASRGMTAGTPNAYTIAHSTLFGSCDIMVYPAPTTAKTLIAFVKARPRQCLVFREEFQATSNTTRTFVTPGANASWVGSIVRVSQNSISGKEDEDLREGKFSWQSVIIGVSGTTVTVATDIPSGFSSTPALVSSFIDVDSNAMQTLFESIAWEKYCCQNAAINDSDRAIAIKAKQDNLRAARANDQKASSDMPSKIYSETLYPIVDKGPKYTG